MSSDMSSVPVPIPEATASNQAEVSLVAAAMVQTTRGTTEASGKSRHQYSTEQNQIGLRHRNRQVQAILLDKEYNQSENVRSTEIDGVRGRAPSRSGAEAMPGVAVIMIAMLL